MPLRGTLRSDPSNLLVNANAGLCKRPKYIPHFYLRISYPPMISILFVQLGLRGDNMRNTNLQAMIESAILAAFAPTSTFYHYQLNFQQAVPFHLL